MCFPGREDQPRTVRRQLAFGHGWSAHMRGIVAACSAAGKSSSVVSFVFMLGTDGRRMTMLTGYDSDAVQLVPEALFDLSESDHDELGESRATHSRAARSACTRPPLTSFRRTPGDQWE